MNNTQNQAANYVIEATNNLIESKLSELKFDETIEATIINQTQDNKNKYLVQYNDLKFYAISNSEFDYSTGGHVYILIPQGDWSQEKIIIGSVPSNTNQQINRVFNNNLNQMIISRECSVVAFNYIPNYNCIGLELYLQSIDNNHIQAFNIDLRVIDINDSNNGIELGNIFSNEDVIGNTGFFNSSFPHYKLLSISPELLQFLKNNKTKNLQWQLILSNNVAEYIEISNFKIYIGYNTEHFENDSMEIFTNSNLYKFDENNNIIPDQVFFELYNYNNNKIFNIRNKKETETIYAYKYSIGTQGTKLSGPYWQPVDVYGNITDENNNIFEEDIPNQDLVFYTNCSNEEQETIYKFIWTSLENGVEIKKGEKTITYLNPNKIETEIDIPNFNSTQPLKLSLEDGNTGIYNVYGMDGKITGSQDQEIHTVSVSLYSEGENDTDTKLIPENISSIFWTYPESIYNNGTFVLPKSGIIEEYEYDTDNQTYIPTNIKFWQSGDDWLEGRPLQFKYKLNSQCYDSYTNNTISCTIVLNDGNIYVGDITLEFGGYRSQGTPYSLNIDIIGEQKFIAPLENTSIQLKATFERIDGKDLDVLPIYSWSMITNDEVPHTLEVENETATLTIVDSGWRNGLIIQVNVEYVIDNLSEPIIFTEYLPIACSLDSSYRCVGPNRIVYDMYGDISYDKTPYNLYMDNTFSNIVADLEWSISNFDPNILSHQFKIIKNSNGIEKTTNELIPETFSLVNSQAVFDLVIAKKDGMVYWCQPIVTIHNRWNDELLNNWNGETVTGNDGILTPYMAAGSKDKNNTFTGVMLGAAADVWGLYGYQNGIPRFYFTEEGEAYIGNGNNDQFISLKNNEGLNIKTQKFELKVGNNSIIANDDGLSLNFQDNFSVKDYSNHGFWINGDGLFTISTVSLDLKVNENNRITMDRDTLELRFTKDFWISDNKGNYISIEDTGMELQFSHSFTISDKDNSNFLKFIDNSLALQSNNFELKAGHSYITTFQTEINDQYVYTVLEDGVNCIIASDNITLEKYTGSLTYCSVPNNIIFIAQEAFFKEEGNAQLRNIQLPNSLKKINDRAFSRCVNITSLIIPSSVETLSSSACESMFGLRYIELGGSSGIMTVPRGLCADCSNLSTIVIREGVSLIQPNAFCTNNTNRQVKIWIPKSLVTFAPNIFEETALVNIYYEGSQEQANAIQTNIAQNVWLNNAHWHYDVAIENFDKQNTYEESIQVNLTNGYFYNNNYEETSYIKFIDGEVDVKTSRFDLQVGNNQIIADSNNLQFTFSEDFYLGDKTKNNYISFGDEYDSKVLKIKSSQLELEAGHSYIRSLRSAYAISEYPVLHEDNYVLELSDDNTYYIFSDYRYQYYYASIPREYNGLPIKIIGTGGGAISEDIQARESQRRLAFPDTVVKINNLAFADFINLQSVILPNFLQEIGTQAFAYCSSLQEIYIPGTVTIIQNGVFSSCVNLQKVILGNGLKRINSEAFKNAGSSVTNLSISIPLSLQYIEENAFTGQQNIDIYYEGTQKDWNGIYVDSTNFSGSTITMHYEETLPLPYVENIALCLSNGYDIDDEYGWENSSYIKFEDGDVDIKTNNFKLYCGNSYINAQSNGASSTFDFVFSNGLNGIEESYIKFVNSDLSIKTNTFDLNTPNLRLTDSNTTSLVNEWVLAADGSFEVSQTFEIYDFGLTLLDGGFPKVKLGLVNSYDWTNIDGSTETIPIYGLTIYDGAFQLYGSDYTAPLIWTDQGDMFIRGRLANADEYDLSTYLMIGPAADASSGAGLHMYVDSDGAPQKIMGLSPLYYNNTNDMEFVTIGDLYVYKEDGGRDSCGLQITENGGKLQGAWECEVNKISIPDPDRPTEEWIEIFYGTGHISGSSGLVIRSKYSEATDQNSTGNMVLDGITLKGHDADIMINTHDGAKIHTIGSDGHNTLILYDGTYYYKPVRKGNRSIGSDNINFMVAAYDTNYSPTAHYIHVEASGGGGSWGYARGIPTYESDRRLKFNIQDTQIKGLPIIRQLHHVEFQWKANQGYVKNGFIAQEMEELIPDAVLSVPQPDGSDIKQLLTHNILPYATKAIQELDEKIIELENQIQELKSQLNF